MNDQNLIEKMKQTNFYPHETKDKIEVVQTHVSIVFLTGEYAYKVKKAVNFGFLDFSTLEKRKHFCEQELSMNQPIAPDIYLEVIPLSKNGDEYHIGDRGEIVEYAVKMRQFPQETLLSELYSEGKLTANNIKELGKIVADFHAQTNTNDYILSFGKVEQLRKSIDENYQQTMKYIGIAQTQEHYDETKHFTDTFFSTKQDICQERIKKQKIRECHGDLHLRNICYWNNQIQLFDRIEFNEPFRFVDTMYDVAFTVMDLEARGSKDLANVFLNSYLEVTGDWEGVQMLPLYLSRQAYVRAKVTSFLLDDPAISPNIKEEAQETASKYYQQAWEYTKNKQGKLIIMSGLSGSGKSTVGQKLANQIGAIQIKSDAVRKHLAGIPVTQKGSQDIYTSEMSEKTYNRLLDLGVMLAKIGFPVILDAKYDWVSLRNKVQQAAELNQIPFEIIYCTAPVDVLGDRLSSRENDISDATPDLLAKQITDFEDFTESEQKILTVVDTNS
jgi:uncharacterized protein